MKTKTKSKFIFHALLHESKSENYFTGIPDDLREFITKPDGTLRSYVDTLNPSTKYKISIKIESI